jgi:hypothetical protein
MLVSMRIVTFCSVTILTTLWIIVCISVLVASSFMAILPNFSNILLLGLMMASGIAGLPAVSSFWWFSKKTEYYNNPDIRQLAVFGILMALAILGPALAVGFVQIWKLALVG